MRSKKDGTVGGGETLEQRLEGQGVLPAQNPGRPHPLLVGRQDAAATLESNLTFLQK